MTIRETRSYSVDEQGHPQSRELADLLAREQSPEEITQLLAAGHRVRFFQMRDVPTDGEGRPRSQSVAAPLLTPEQVDAMSDVLYRDYAARTGVRVHDRGPALSAADAAYAAYAAACGIRDPASLRAAE